MRRRQTRVYLALVWHELGHMLGINRYACEANWDLTQWHKGETDQLQPLHPHGIISQLAAYEPDLVKAVEAAHAPMVELCNPIPGMRVPRVMPDQEAEGVLAAAHLIERGFTRFVYIGYSKDSGSKQAFTQPVRAANGECQVIFIDDPEVERETGKFLTASQVYHDELSALRRAWARRLFSKCAKPVGVYVRSSVWAFDIIESCRNAHIPVPEQVAVVSLADMTNIGATWRVPLTVVVPDYEEQGYQAARLLDRMMKGEHVPPDMIVRVPPLDLVPRQSTLCRAMDNLAIARATTFIMSNLHDVQLCAKKVQWAVKASRTNFYRDFTLQLRMPVARYIEHLRLKEALHLLDTTDATAGAIAAHCGFGDLPRFRLALRRATGMGPAAWRRRRGDSASVRPCVGASVGEGKSASVRWRLLVPASRRDQYVGTSVAGSKQGGSDCHVAILPAPAARLRPQEPLVARRPSRGRNEAPVEAPVNLFAVDHAILSALDARKCGRKDLLKALGYAQRSGSFKKSINKLLAANLIERTIPAKPNSRLQQYRLTEKARQLAD